jgi:cell division protein FtsL
VKDEIEFSILRISEKRYKAEAEVELLTKQLAERDAEIAALKAQVKSLSEENSLLKTNKKGGMAGSNATSPRRAMPGVSDRSVTVIS